MEISINGKRIAVVGVIISLLLVYIFIEFKATNSPTIHGYLWSDIEKFKDDMNAKGYEVKRTVTFPGDLTEKSAQKTLFVILDPRNETRDYSHKDIEKIKEYIKWGAKLIYAPSNNSDLMEVFNNIDIFGHRLYDKKYAGSLDFPLVKFRLDAFEYDVIMSEPTGLHIPPGIQNTEEIGAGSNKSYMDMDDNGIIDMYDVKGPIPCGFIVDKAKVLISNGAPFTDDLYYMSDNMFIRALVAHLLPAGGKIIIEESIHKNTKSPYKHFLIKNETGFPYSDHDNDGLGDIDEFYTYGTNSSNPDTDGDGMTDDWEVKYGLDPKDPTDAYEDPDRDGYDFNGDGIKTEQFPMGEPQQARDRIYFSDLNVAPDNNFTLVDVKTLRTNPKEWTGKLIRIKDAKVVDNGTYKDGMGSIVGFNIGVTESERILCTVRFWVNDKVEKVDRLDVCVEIGGNKPINIDMNTTRIFVDIQGLFYMDPNTLEVQVQIRGGEEFTNIMEFQATRDYDNNPLTDNETDPLSPDTDGDGICDGWEVAYGKGFYNARNQGLWEWISRIDPTWARDKNLDIDGDLIKFNDEWRGGNFDEYSFGTNPTMVDSDMDSFDNRDDGWTVDDDNSWDFSEVFIYNTTPTNPDTDEDGMTDGWEIHYGIYPSDPNDAGTDPDGDGFENLDEFNNGTDPRDPTSHP